MSGLFHRRHWRIAAVIALAVIPFRSVAADTLEWRTNEDRVSADIRSAPVLNLLEGVARLTGWQIYVESNTTFTVSAKFRDLTAGEALRHLLGNLNFALVPETNSPSRLYVFRSSRENATLRVRPGDLNSRAGASDKKIPDELVVTLKRGLKPETIACLNGAKVTGRLETLNTYRVKFENESAGQIARECLSDDPDVASVDSNFSVDRPSPDELVAASSASDINLTLKDPSGCQPIVAVIDTGFGSLGKDLDKFLLPRISLSDNPSATRTAPSDMTHGQAMAETILRSLQSTTGGTTSAKILPVDIYGNNASTSTFDVAQGVYRAVNAGANVVNLSLGGSGDSTFLHDLIVAARQKGVIFFGAAGNEPVTTATYPAAYPEVVAVTAADRNGQIASYANRGSFVDIITPGTSVVPFNGQSYAVSGTSAATAYASGIAAGLADSSKKCPDQVVPVMLNKLGMKPNPGQ